ncbi:MAG: hypothetical protein ABJB74_01300, partial [Gemmatimonas sp.]
MKRTLLTIGFLLCAVGPAAEAQVVDVHGTYTQNVANQIPWAFGQTTYDMRTLVDNGPLLAMAATRRSNTPNVIDNGNGTWNALAGRDPNNVNPN